VRVMSREAGISALDQKRGHYYFATDYQGAFIYGTDIPGEKRLPTLSIGASHISALAYSTTTDRLYVLYVEETSGDVLLAGLNPLRFDILLSLPSKYDPTLARLRMAVDEQRRILYITARIRSAPEATNGLIIFDLEKSTIIHEVAIDPSSGNLYPQYLWVDQVTGNIMAATLDQDPLGYFLLGINPQDGSCSKVLIQIPRVIVSAWSWDPTKGILWASGIAQGQAGLIEYDTHAGNMTAFIQMGALAVPDTLEIISQCV